MHFLVYLELHSGELKKPSLEVLAEARRLAAECGGKVSAVLLGPGASETATRIEGAGRVFASDDEVHDTFHLGCQADLLVRAVKTAAAQVVFLAATALGRELAAAAAADLDTVVAADVTAIRLSDGSVEVTRPVYAGKALLTSRYKRLPAVVTLRPNVFSPQADTSTGKREEPPEVEQLGAPDAAGYRSRIVETLEPEVRQRDLTEAEVIVSGGRGLGGPDHFSILESLATKLGAVVGASRAVCDAGWRPHSDQVGQTGKTVSPKLYIAVGISGAIQHLAGMSSSRCIVAINKDPNAPIFQVADYGIVGDLFDVVPALEKEL